MSTTTKQTLAETLRHLALRRMDADPELTLAEAEEQVTRELYPECRMPSTERDG